MYSVMCLERCSEESCLERRVHAMKARVHEELAHAMKARVHANVHCHLIIILIILINSEMSA